MECRACASSDLSPVLDLGHHPISNAFLTREKLTDPEVHYPLVVVNCGRCGLSQLSYVVPPRELFTADYPYDSSISETLRRHFEEMAGHISRTLSIEPGSLAIDIGSNAGVLLQAFQDEGLKPLGVEPADNMAAKANSLGLETLNAFFSPAVSDDIVSLHGQARLITATNVFAHVDDIAAVVAGVRNLLTQDGVFVVEAQYFLDMVQHTEYDQIYHEHLSYMTVTPLISFFRSNGMEVFHVEHVETHGGSIRVFVGLPGHRQINSSVAAFCHEEEATGVLGSSSLQAFSKRVSDSRDQLLAKLVGLKESGNRLVGIGAPAKGNTLLNYCHIGTNLLDYLTDAAPSKIGLYSPGGHIPVVAESALMANPPDYGVLLAWNISEELMKKFDSFHANGGQFIIPVPSLRII